MQNKHEIGNGRNLQFSLPCLTHTGTTNLSDIILHFSLTVAFGTLAQFLFFKCTNFFPVLGLFCIYSHDGSPLIIQVSMQRMPFLRNLPWISNLILPLYSPNPSLDHTKYPVFVVSLHRIYYYVKLPYSLSVQCVVFSLEAHSSWEQCFIYHHISHI